MCVIPLEYGYSKGTIASCRKVDPGIDGIPIRITSKNTKPTEKAVRLRTIKFKDKRLTMTNSISEYNYRSNLQESFGIYKINDEDIGC